MCVRAINVCESKESDFSLIHEYCIGDFNSHSDHAPLYFTIFGHSVVNSNSSDDQVKL